MDSPRRMAAEERLRRGAGPPENRRFTQSLTIQTPLLHSRAHVELARFMIPAFIYFANNNIVFLPLVAQKHSKSKVQNSNRARMHHACNCLSLCFIPC